MARAIYCLLLLAVVLGAIEAHVTYKRRPTYSFYTKDGSHNPILNHPAHRRAARAAMPIPRRPTAALPATTIPPASQVPSIDENGYCQAWSQQHYRSFDGKLFSFHGACTYTLVTDCLDFSFHIYVENDLNCQEQKENNTCSRSVLIDNGNPSDMIYLRPGGIVTYKDVEQTLPTKAGGMVLERIAHYTLATSGLGFSILYDGGEAITVYATSDSLKGNTCGLCGVYDEDPSNDFRTPSGTVADDAYSFGLSWKGMDERDPAYCPDVPTVPLRCTQYSNFESTAAETKAQFAESECAQLRHGTFMACHQVVDPEPYIVACEQDVCACEMKTQEDNTTGNDCKCAAFTAYTQECSRRGFQVTWRSYDFCAFDCPADKVYDQCGSACTQRGCSTAIADCETDETVGCIEGCHCPTGTYRSSAGTCVSANQCFCSWQGTEYEPGKQISDGCNECECVDGKWQCSQNDCGGMCQVSGYGHYHTFDNYDYDFAGTCSYTLVKNCWSLSSIYMVTIENAPCGMEGASCVKAVVLEDGMNVVRLRRGHQVLINGQEVTEFPKTVGNIFVNQPTKHQTAAVMANGLTILFDGNNRVAVMADERHLNATCGLCGTYNNNQRDDFYTEAGDIESNPTSFANKWKLGSSCPDASDDPGADPCDLYSQKALTAESECNRLYIDDAFAACRQYVDPEVFYESCRRDVCNCETGDTCKCEIFAMYATQCAQKGVIVNWRSETPGCGINCEGGLVYSACHPMCETTCNALSSNSVCDETCVEGCACPDGSVMAPHGACVAPENCGCVDPDTGETYAPGERIEKGCGFCLCDSGAWACEELDCPMDACLANQVYVPCVSPCVKSCSNMHEFESCSAATCYGGCECAEDSVWNGTNCVLPTSCPCHHGGHSYSEGYIIQTDECHSCTCTNSKWECREKNCHGVCTAWGDPHYKTFDGKLFDFQGDCDYVMVTDSVSQASGIPFFHIVVSNIPCGTSAVTCTKSITFSIGTGSNQEKLILVRGKPTPASAGSFRLTEVGNYVYVHTTQRITLIWDRGTWIQVKLDPMYKEKVGGMCGNFNDLISDDFLSPAGGLPETSSIDFGNSWKVHDYCPRPEHIIHPCLFNPFRRAWAMRQCSVLKSDTFAACHSEVSYRPYYSRCIFDTCGCDSGGDCECLCTAIAAYAQECNAQGVHIPWRSNDFCPMQCDDCSEYNPCIPVCDMCGHEDRWDENGECPDTCVEGCKCPDGQFYDDGKCVDACPTTTPPTTVSTTTPWESTSTPTTGTTTGTTPTTTPETSPFSDWFTSEETTTVSTTPATTTATTTIVYDTTTPKFTLPPYTPPYNTCYCHGYGDPHYTDFYGNDFDHQGNCTYILSQDTSHNPPLYTVLIHNVECERFPGTTCPRDLEIIYNGTSTVLQSEFYIDGSHLVVIDGVQYVAPMELPAFRVISLGFYLIYQAPAIGLEVRFIPLDNHYFSVEVPEAIFYNYTEGLCGNCGKNETTCEEDSSCCDLVPPEHREDCGCDDSTTPCPPTDSSREWCQHIYDPVFDECHAIVDPAPYFRDCLYDDCYANDTTCWAFEAYATMCANQGICLEWRHENFCPMDCVDPFEYRQCACPTFEFPSCEKFNPEHMPCQTEPVNGCFCPEGTMPVSNDTCVPCPSTTPLYTTSEFFSTTQEQTTYITTPTSETTTEETTSRATTTNPTTTPLTTTTYPTTTSYTTTETTTTTIPTTTYHTTTEGYTTLPETTKSATTTEVTTETTTTNPTTTIPTTSPTTSPLITTEGLTTLPETTKAATTSETTTKTKTTTNPTTTIPTTFPTTTPLTTTESLSTLHETTESATTTETTTEAKTTTNPTTTMPTSPTTTPLITTEGSTTMPETTKSARTSEATTETVTTTNPTTTIPTSPKTTPLITTEGSTTMPETTKSATTAEATTETVTTTNPITTIPTTSPTTTKPTTTPPTLPITTTEVLTTLSQTSNATTTAEETTEAVTTIRPTTTITTTSPTTTPLITTEGSTTMPETTKSATTAEATTEAVTTIGPTTTITTTSPTATITTTSPTTTMEKIVTTASETTEAETTVVSTKPITTTFETTTESIETTTELSTAPTTVQTTTLPTTIPPETTPYETTAEITTETISETTTKQQTTDMKSTTMSEITTEQEETTTETTTREETTVSETFSTTVSPTTESEITTSLPTTSSQPTSHFAPTTPLQTKEITTTHLPFETTPMETTTEGLTTETTTTLQTTSQTTQEETTAEGTTTSESATTSEGMTTTTTKEQTTTSESKTSSSPPMTETTTTGFTTREETTAATTELSYTSEETTAAATTDTSSETTVVKTEGERSPMTETSTFFSGGTTDANQPTGQTSLASGQTQATEIMTGSASSTVPSTEEVTRPECCPEECTEATPTVPSTPSTPSTPETTTEGGCETVEVCEWTSWCDDEAQTGDKLTSDDDGEYELIETCRELNHDVCEAPIDIECETAFPPHYGAGELGQTLTCDKDVGLECPLSKSQPICFDYRVRFLCCRNVSNDPSCLTTTSPTTIQTTQETTTKSTTPMETETTAKPTTKTVGSTNSAVKNPTLPTVTYPTHSGCGTAQGTTPTIISYNNCTAPDPVYLNECRGKCSSSHTFTKIIDGQMIMDQYCSCCKPESVIEDVVELECPDGTTTTVNVPFIQTCSCNEVDC